MTAIRIDGVRRTFGSVHAVKDLSLDIGDGEFFTLLGPSGCGKTTLLRMIAGFNDPDAGRIFFGDRRIDTVPAHRRNTGMVFQNYAIFPNLTVAGNVAYGLKARGVAGAERNERIARALALVQLPGYGDRWPHQLSGGQLQRVALARALVIEPSVLLLDEPLSNLDAKLRVEMRAEIRQVQQQLGITAIYVTHDQEEALAISDRIAVMRGGSFEQIGTPTAVYATPATPFVAEFMGTTNLLAGRIAGQEGPWTAIEASGSRFLARPAAGSGAAGEAVTISLRPEAIRLAETEPAPAGWATLSARVARVEFLGPVTRIDLRLPGDALLRMAMLEPPPAALADQNVTVAYAPARVTVFAP